MCCRVVSSKAIHSILCNIIYIITFAVSSCECDDAFLANLNGFCIPYFALEVVQTIDNWGHIVQVWQQVIQVMDGKIVVVNFSANHGCVQISTCQTWAMYWIFEV